MRANDTLEDYVKETAIAWPSCGSVLVKKDIFIRMYDILAESRVNGCGVSAIMAVVSALWRQSCERMRRENLFHIVSDFVSITQNEDALLTQ